MSEVMNLSVENRNAHILRDIQNAFLCLLCSYVNDKGLNASFFCLFAKVLHLLGVLGQLFKN